MSDPAVKSFVGRVRDILHDLSPSERRLAEFALDFPGDLAGYSASELASLAHVSNATVTRFIRRLGYSNYEAARKQVRSEKKAGSPLLLAATEDFQHQAYREPAMPDCLRLVLEMREAGIASVVSGAGPTVLVLTERDALDVAATTALGPVLRERALQRLAGRLVDGVLTVSASEHRSQLRNREAAQARLVAVLAEAIAPPPRQRRPTRPSRRSQERRIAEKKRRGEIKRTRRDLGD